MSEVTARVRIPREIKIGVTALLTIAAFVWLYGFLKGENILKRTSLYYIVYDDVSGLKESDPVEVSGYKVGIVQDVSFIDDGSGRLIVSLSIEEKIAVPKGSVAEITPASLIAGMKIRLLFSGAPAFYSSGDTIKGRVEQSILVTAEKELLPLRDGVTSTLARLDSVLAGIDKMLSPSFIEDLNQSAANIKEITGSLGNTLQERERELSETVENLHRFSGVMAERASSIDTMILNIAAISDSLAKSDLFPALSSLSKAANETSELLAELNSGKGSAGMLLKDDAMYINLTRSLEDLQRLLEDLRENPGRYLHFSIFGRRNN